MAKQHDPSLLVIFFKKRKKLSCGLNISIKLRKAAGNAPKTPEFLAKGEKRGNRWIL